MQAALHHLKKADPILCELIERLGPCRITYRPANFDTLARSIVFQQLSGRVARVIFDRLVAAMPDGRVSPAGLLRLRTQRLRRIGLSSQKIAYLRDLARQTQAGAIDFQALNGATDAEVIAQLTQVKGIGVWTAQMFLIFALRRPDVLPTTDLGIRKAMQNAYQLPALPKPPIMEALAAPWRPYCSVACWYLWRSLDGVAGI